MMEIISSLIIGLFAMGITCYYSSHAKKISQDEIFYALYSKFNERYDKINGEIQKLYNQNLVTELKLLDLKNNEVQYRAVIDFFNICAEEYYWKNEKNRIDPKVWFAWEFGMNFWYLNIKAVRELWQEEIAGDRYKSYYLQEGDNLFKKID